MDKNTKYFIWGIISGMFLIPVIEEFSNVFLSWIQVLLIKPNKLVLKGNQELSDLRGEDESVQTQCIGFQVPSCDDCCDDYDE